MAQTVSYNYAGGVNFAELKTYKWVNIEGAESPDRSLDKSIREAIEFQLTRKGLTKSAEHANLSLPIRRVSCGNGKSRCTAGGDSRWDTGLAGFGMRAMATTTATPTQRFLSATSFSTCIAEVSNALIFVGDADKRWQHLNKAVTRLFGPYPPKPRK